MDIAWVSLEWLTKCHHFTIGIDNSFVLGSNRGRHFQ